MRLFIWKGCELIHLVFRHKKIPRLDSLGFFRADDYSSDYGVEIDISGANIEYSFQLVKSRLRSFLINFIKLRVEL